MIRQPVLAGFTKNSSHIILLYIFHFPRSRIGFEKLRAMTSAIRSYRELSELTATVERF
jgi:hypothetical protein